MGPIRRYLERRRVLRLLAELERSLGGRAVPAAGARLQPGVRRRAANVRF